MSKAHANPDNLPFCEYEEFVFEKDHVRREPQRLYGNLKKIRAHTAATGIAVTYSEIIDLEILSEKKIDKPVFAVSFNVRFQLRRPDSQKIAGYSEENNSLTRVCYWNFSEKDFYELNFLRHTTDKVFFVNACDEPHALLGIASAHQGTDKVIADHAYERALQFMRENAADDQLLAAFRGYLSSLPQSFSDISFSDAIHAYRGVDRSGTGSAQLALFCDKIQQSREIVTEILAEGIKRLLLNKPRGYSMTLAKILDFAWTRGMASPSPEQLLWQTYLAAAAERELDVLRRVWLRARKMKADTETLQLIYNTWRGFASPRKALLPEKAGPQISAPP